MLTSTFGTYTDPDQVEDLLRRRTSHVRFTMTGAGNYRADMIGIDLHRVRLNRVRVNLPHIMHSTILLDHVLVGFVAAGSLHLMNGVEPRPGEMFVGPPRAEHHTQFEAGSGWGCMFIPPDDLRTVSLALIGRELKPLRDWNMIRTDPAVMTRLLQLHQAACRLARLSPDIFMHPEIARVFEDALVRASINCLTDPEKVVRNHMPARRVMQRFEEVLTSSDYPLYLTDVCAAIGVAARTLRRHCLQHLGMGPHEYLWRRRMQLARRALRDANPITATVASIANNCGFAELGRFAVRYRAMFGELPSETLRRN